MDDYRYRGEGTKRSTSTPYLTGKIILSTIESIVNHQSSIVAIYPILDTARLCFPKSIHSSFHLCKSLFQEALVQSITITITPKKGIFSTLLRKSWMIPCPFQSSECTHSLYVPHGMAWHAMGQLTSSGAEEDLKHTYITCTVPPVA